RRCSGRATAASSRPGPGRRRGARRGGPGGAGKRRSRWQVSGGQTQAGSEGRFHRMLYLTKTAIGRGDLECGDSSPLSFSFSLRLLLESHPPRPGQKESQSGGESPHSKQQRPAVSPRAVLLTGEGDRPSGLGG